MTKMMQAFVAVPISEAIGRAFGGNTMLGVGAALVTEKSKSLDKPPITV